MFSEIADRSLFEKVTSYGNDFIEKVFERHVAPLDKALEMLSAFDEDLPEKPGNSHEIIDLLQTKGAPNTMPHIGGRYFGFVTGGVVPAGLAAKGLASFWDQNSALQIMSPISSKLESVVQRWLVDLFGLPDKTVAGFVSGTSMANFCGLAAARYRILKRNHWDINEKGLFGAPKIRVVTGKHAHSTILKAISLVGLGKENIEWVDVDQQGRICVDKIPELDENTILILQAGNVNSGAFDDFETLFKEIPTNGAWVHIDGAFGLWAAGTERLQHLTKGFEQANSWAVDAHKTLNVPYDSGIVLCNDSEALTSAFHMNAGYIVTGQERDGMFFTPEMSRRSRAIELWATLKYLGRTGIDDMIFEMHQRAKQFAQLISKVDGFQVLNDVVFNQVIVQCESDELTDKTLKKIQELRDCWVGGSTWNGRKVIRISVCSWATTEKDIVRSINSFKQALDSIQDKKTKIN
ncbi:aminotransferase class V-fold PLP-dependent enzyme [Muricauda sp. JGD-17]|uniref:Aminotransferase class V-fold PLP-dependent enzyme n=2 Tax=Flagellimonas ochracea TaxID=2696472 RepID=A0A964TBM2_9FLAO|nr:aminotransferase class V-fold PLP-dependent enzyme [Allomuricauda ochracea]